uniref:Lipocalin n=1 Tax=Argas monolakensis TaxID=34602 RepID=Q09JV2_ARGMO|nr:lipocalin [Argas monolakensis]
MFLLLVFASVHFTCGYAAGSSPVRYKPTSVRDFKSYLEGKEGLKQYQDGWKFLTTGKEMYLYQRSFQEDPKYGNKCKCVKSKHLTVKEEAQTVAADLSFLHENLTSVHFTVYFSVNKTGKESRVIYASYEPEKPGFPFPVAFADYESCAVVRVPHRDKGKNQACELWVYKDHVKRVKSCCFFIFDLLCGPNKYKVYDEEKCKE